MRFKANKPAFHKGRYYNDGDLTDDIEDPKNYPPKQHFDEFKGEIATPIAGRVAKLESEIKTLQEQIRELSSDRKGEKPLAGESFESDDLSVEGLKKIKNGRYMYKGQLISNEDAEKMINATRGGEA